MTSKIPAIALVLVFGLAACRGEDPDQAPPVGSARAAPVAAAAVATGPSLPSLVSSRRALDVEARSRLYRKAAAEARNRLDVDWNQCGNLDGDPFVRCRDEAVVHYDQAMNRARDEYGDDFDERGAMVPGTLDNPGEIAAIQVTGTRG